MKRKIEIYRESGLDDSGTPIRETVKTFKNEPEAIAFYNDQRNARRYGTLFMVKRAGDGSTYAWDDRKQQWNGGAITA